MDEEDVKELPRLQHEMEVTIMDLRESEYYLKLRDDLNGDQLLRSEISRRIGSKEHVQMVIYGLGSLEYSFQPQFQFALALLLREEVDILRIGEIQVYDPKITPVDANVIRSFGCTVLSVNEFARRRVENPTIIFLPFAWYNQVANLLEVNWSSSRLKNLIILGVSMHNWNGTYDEPYYEMFHIDETEKLTANDRWFPTLDKIRVDHEDAKPSGDWIRKLRDRMQRFYLQQFAPNQKWKNNFHGENVSRAPSRYLKTWSIPQAGWIKLNFDGYGNESYGYGGILCNDDGEILLSYAGPMPSANTNHDNHKGTIAAQVEGLRQGVRCFKQLLSLSYDDHKLIIEGSALSVVRWANAVAPPPHTFEEAFKEMCVMLEETNCLVYHIYPEANDKACELAKLGIKLTGFNSWSRVDQSCYYYLLNHILGSL
ncbi:hypothetical protein J5N97_009569 [Dioscorea zingiberensis]|uniref:SRR1-like domain-containing protein n=1 Tax=Dioscorea zingiberensis TaxID=325984 RepID=A0A9D5CYH7_9LILI|nr:hypothetical protein J5N97_009569 [Dioscorea zingiberensis]